MKLRTKPILTKFARDNRKNMTAAEELLWQRIRNRKLNNLKFRRQEPIGDYIVDFVCLAQKLIIEIDGEYHNEIDQMEYDNNRTDFLQFDDFRVIRFTNSQILSNIDEVLKRIARECQKSY